MCENPARDKRQWLMRSIHWAMKNSGCMNEGITTIAFIAPYTLDLHRLALYNLYRISTNQLVSWLRLAADLRPQKQPPGALLQAFDCAQKLHAKRSPPPSFWRFVKMKRFPYFPSFPFCSSPSKLSSQHLLTLPSLWTPPRTLLIAFLGLQQLVSKLLHFSQTLTSKYQFLDPVGMRVLSPAQSRLQAPLFLQCLQQ